ncbi:SOS response-associated peptidase [Salinicola sp. CR57]|uniref:SOS response-associated peptidase n=1 Tax=Salinicola sp. CR57 TaxID=1949086 RepID=UPI000DA22CEA|nr:SOS response-associated peptidase [Salinicola sp. CR57]
MCSRFSLYSTYQRFAHRIGELRVDEPPTPRYNVAPGTWISSIRRQADDPQLTFDSVWWGYKPKWAGETAPQPINARVETVATSNFYQAAFQRHRCLIPADGWFEWLPGTKPKQPHFLCREDREPFFFAGIWTERVDGKPGVAILTEPARGSAVDVHDRMPLILTDESIEPWLDPALTDRETIRRFVKHVPAEAFTHWAVSTRVNKPGEGDIGEVYLTPV